MINLHAVRQPVCGRFSQLYEGALLVVTTPSAPGGVTVGDTAGPTPVRRDPRRLVGALAAAWLLPVLLHSVGLDVLLLPALLLFVASLLRTGGVLLDRLVAAGVVLTGAVLSFGLLFSLWPWGLAPVPTGGVLLSAVALAGWTAGREPRLPLRARWADLLVLGVGGLVWHYLSHPLIGKSAADRLGYFATAEDRFGHFSYFDGIRHVGGYAFLHQEAARTYMMTPAEAVYPQGSHFLLAWIDALVRGTTDPGSAVGAMNRYLFYVLACYTLLCTLLVWGARYLGGPRLRGWRTAAVCGSVAALVLASNDVDLIGHGFDSMIVGLMFLAAVLPLLIRASMGRGDFLVIAVTGLVMVTYAYNLYGVFVGFAVLGALLVHRRRLGGRWSYGLLVLGLGLAGLPSAVSVLSKLDVASTANLAGPMVGADRVLLIGAGLLALLAALAPSNRRTAVGRSLQVVLLGSGLAIGGFGWWQLHTIGYYSYYFEKMAAAGIVVALLGLGALGSVIRTGTTVPRSSPRPARWRAFGADAALSGLALAAALSLFAGVQWGVLTAWNKPAAWYSNPLVAWGKGDARTDIAPMAEMLAGRDLARAGDGPVIALYSNDGYQNLRSTFVAELMEHRGAEMLVLYGTLNVKLGADPVPEAQYQESMDKLRAMVSQLGAEPTLLVADKNVADRVRADLSAHQLPATVLHASLG
ncbi:hypothetical protein [Kitasatospora sp. NPDC088783]|uniref:hypothetical protein n=1 Tax=Kitasatospora sp. NPDC088783 TaxID=3364077 RepID=UPI00380C0B29